jgi:hypothetical protein
VLSYGGTDSAAAFERADAWDARRARDDLQRPGSAVRGLGTR